MVQPDIDGLDTPRTNIGDVTYLSRQPDFDLSQEASFQSPSKDAHLLHQLRHGGRPSLRTPRGNRAPFADRRNLPASLGGGEFTPLLKSATRNGARRALPGKENGLATPAFLDRIDEDLTALPRGESSVYGAASRDGGASSYMSSTPLLAVDTDGESTASTPMVMRRRGGGKDLLQDGQQLSLREQENVIDRIEKENFGLKLKIHFLEEALRKAGPGFSEAALRENTELKVDKVTMQRELQKYKKHLVSAEKDLESYRQQILDVQEKARRKFADDNLRAEIESLRRALEEKGAETEDLRRAAASGDREREELERLQDDVANLEADARRKDQVIGEHEEKIEELRDEVEEAEEQRKSAERRAVELEEKAKLADDLDDAKNTIEELEANVREFERRAAEMEDRLEDAVAERKRAEEDLEELQDEMANKSMVTKGLSRQVEEKMTRLQGELELARRDCKALHEQHASARQERDTMQAQLTTLRQERDSSEDTRQSLTTALEKARAEAKAYEDEKNLLHVRHEALLGESASLQKELERLQKTVRETQDDLDRERQHALAIQKDLRGQHQDEIDSLQAEIQQLEAEGREKDKLYDVDTERWERECHDLGAQRDVAEERAAGLQRTIDKLREVEGSLSSKETQLQEVLTAETNRHKSEEALLTRQMEELRQTLAERQASMETLRDELSGVRDELRRSRADGQARVAKVEALEDEVEVLQATLDDECDKFQRELQQARRECDEARRQVQVLQQANDAGKKASSPGKADSIATLTGRLSDMTETLAQVTRERDVLQEEACRLGVELDSLREALDKSNEARQALEAQLDALNRSGKDDKARLDQERRDLRPAKARLEGELGRLEEEKQALSRQRERTEAALHDEAEKAATEEARLRQEVARLQSELLRSSEDAELISARRKIRELEHRIGEHDMRLAAAAQMPREAAADGNSELSLLHQDLDAARQRELDLLQREASQRDTIKALKRQLMDLERKAHQAELTRMGRSPSSSHDGSAQKAELAELRHQLSTAHQTAHDLRRAVRDAESKAATQVRELQRRMDELAEQKLAQEEAVEAAQAAADDAAAAHEAAQARVKTKLERYKTERDELATALRAHRQSAHGSAADHSDVSLEERRDLHAMLRASQTTADRLERQVRQQRQALEEVAAAEGELRRKLERARSERAAYRASAERLQRDVKALRAAAAAEEEERAEAVQRPPGEGRIDTEVILRAADAAERRHEKEIRGMVMQMEWLKACWDREAKLRSDAAFAKRYLLLELRVRDACNKADLAIINRIRGDLHGRSRTALSQLNLAKQSARPQTSRVPAHHPARDPRTALQRVLTVVRFVVRMQAGARAWARHEQVRRRLADCVQEMEHEERIKKKREEWCAEAAGSLEA